MQTLTRQRDDFAPEFSSAPPARLVQQASTGTALYEGGSTERRLRGWRAPTTSPNAAILPNLTTLRDRSRSAVRNNGHAKGAIDKLVTNLIGTGVKPLCLAEDLAFREKQQRLWNDWTRESDADGLLDWYGQQGQAVRGWLEAGEMFLRLRDRLPGDMRTVPLQVQVLEPELCPHTYNVTLPNGNKVRAGIEFSPIGRRLAYYFHPSRAGDELEWDTVKLVRVPADRVIHLFDPLRAGQIRGVPHLTQALIKLYDLDQFDDATLLRQKLSNLFVAFITRAATADTGAVHPLTGVAPSDADRDAETILLEPGAFNELDPGEEVKFSKPPGTSDGYRDFMRQQLFGVSAATGVPYEVLTGDMSGLNDRVVRVILHEFRRMLQSKQHQIVAPNLGDRVWNVWNDRAFLAGLLEMPLEYLLTPRVWTVVKWTPQAWPYLHPVQDIEATEKAIRTGLTSRSAAVSETGEDAAAIDLEQAADNARADKLALKYDSDGRQPKNGAAVPPPAPASATEGAAA